MSSFYFLYVVFSNLCVNILYSPGRLFELFDVIVKDCPVTIAHLRLTKMKLLFLFVLFSLICTTTELELRFSLGRLSTRYPR